ncbi:MAG: LamG domain-containing protein [Patescibacteria group bacterium]
MNTNKRINEYIRNGGQSLIEIVLGLAIGSVLIGAAVVGVVFVLRSSSVNQYSEAASSLSRALLLRTRSLADADWSSLYNLQKGSEFLYYVAPSGTELTALRGVEGVATDIPTKGLAAHWGLDESSGDIAHDSFPNGSLGRIFGTTYSASCRIGGCRVFDGVQDSLSFGNTPSLNFQKAFTLSLWVRPSEIPTSPDTGLISKGGFRYALTYYSDGDARFYVGDGTNYAHAPVAPGEWRHIAGVFDSTLPAPTLGLYVDGIQVASTTSSFGTSGAEGELLLGEYNFNSFSGRIDDVRIYNRALSSEEISSLYGSPSFTRFFTVQDVFRNPAGLIVPSGGILDPSTEEIAVRVSWIPAGSSKANLELKDYITRWRNEVFHETDWSRGPQGLEPIPEPSGGYSNSTNILFSPGEIRLDEL